MDDYFLFRFSFGSRQYLLKVSIDEVLSDRANACELCRRLMQHHKIPGKYFGELLDQLLDFIKTQSVKVRDKEMDHRIDEPFNLDEIVALWRDWFEKGHLDFSKIELISNEAILSDVYHSLIHSKFIDHLLELEYKYALAIATLLVQRDEHIEKVEEDCRREMEDALSNISIKYTDRHVNQLAKKQIEMTELESSKWTSEICNMKEKQKREYIDQIMKLYESLQIEHTSENSGSKRTEGTPTKLLNIIKSSGYSRREESFTVHLGAQMKTSHNLRLISCDVLDLCQLQVTEMLSGTHVQSAIYLYSHSLCGLVLLVDNRLNSFSGIKKDFARACDQSTDFHFPSLEQQMDKIATCLKETELSKGPQGKLSLSTRMNTGDFYITRHSNLSEIHIVFHLVVDDSLQGEISSRHPVVVACRNVIKTAFQNDITTLTLPLFLVHEMTEEMTIQWCLKRAELVFKCIKGFIMELPYCSFNIQFLVPKALSDETFSSLSTMMPSIFRMSNPVVAKS